MNRWDDEWYVEQQQEILWQKIIRIIMKEIIAKTKAIISYQAEHSMDSNLEYILKK